MYFHAGMPPFRAYPPDPRPQHTVVQVVADHRGHGRDQPRCVLIIGVDHDDDIRALFQGDPVARFLVCPVAPVVFMDVDPRIREGFRNLDGLVMTFVIHHDHEVNDSLSHDFLIALQDRLLRIIGGHNDDDFFSLEHKKVLYQNTK